MAFDPNLYLSLIQNEIRKIRGKKKATAGFTFVLCPFHNEKTPSCKINHSLSKPRSIGWFNCYGCSHSGPWNELAAAFNLEQFGKNVADSVDVPSFDLASFREAMLNDREANEEDNLIRFRITPKNARKLGLENEWRGINLGLIRDTGSTFAVNEETGTYYVLLVALVNEVEVGYVRAFLEKHKHKSIPSYLNKKGEWSKTKGLLFYDYAIALAKKERLSSVCLVEGPRDALRLLSYDIPTMCILGTHSWTDKKRLLLELSGLERVVLLFDGDEAGKNATNLIQDSLYGAMDMKVVELWNYPLPENHKEDKLDPGNMPESMIMKVKKLLR